MIVIYYSGDVRPWVLKDAWALIWGSNLTPNSDRFRVRIKPKLWKEQNNAA